MLYKKLYSNDELVGEFGVLANGKLERYFFEYDDGWIKSGFCIDPMLPLKKCIFESDKLWGIFEDMSPDSWGELIQKRKAGGDLIKSEYLFGGSDFCRIGSFGFSKNSTYLQKDINKFYQSVKNIILGESLPHDIDNFYPSSNMSGAYPKASFIIDDEFYLVKFSKPNDKTLYYEKTMLDLAKLANINVVSSKLDKNTLYIKRFDKKSHLKIPYQSAKTFLNGKGSYFDLALMLSSDGKKELFRRMVFNYVFSIKDDHLKNHGFLYDSSLKNWKLSPAFDLVPCFMVCHSLSFVNHDYVGSMELFYDMKKYFDIDDEMFLRVVCDIKNAAKYLDDIAFSNFLNKDDLKILKRNINIQNLYDFGL